MYTAKNDRIVELKEFPSPDSGAPCPVILPKETQLWLAYYIHDDDALRHAILCHDPNPIWPEVFPVRKCFYTLWGSLLAPFYVLLDWQLPVRRKLNRVYWYLSLPVISRFMGVMSVNLWNY